MGGSQALHELMNTPKLTGNSSERGKKEIRGKRSGKRAESPRDSFSPPWRPQRRRLSWLAGSAGRAGRFRGRPVSVDCKISINIYTIFLVSMNISAL